MNQKQVPEEKKSQVHKPLEQEASKPLHAEPRENVGLERLQQQVGNRAVQRLIAQRSSEEEFELDDETASQINSQRGGGQALDSAASERMSAATGEDFSDVRVHTSPEANELNQQLSAKAFTTGQDIFFREGAYDPGSSSGQELLAHELTHVVQQRSGAVSGSGRMNVNAPGDAFEQQADAVAQSVTGSDAQVQRESLPEEEEEEVQKQELDEDENEEELL